MSTVAHTAPAPVTSVPGARRAGLVPLAAPVRLQVVLPPRSTRAELVEQLTRIAVALGLDGSGVRSLDEIDAGALTPDDVRAAELFGGVVRLAGVAVRRREGVAAWTGPAFIARDHLLAGLSHAHAGVVVDGPGLPEVSCAGPAPLLAAMTAALAGAMRSADDDARPRLDLRLPAPGDDCRTRRSWVARLEFPHQLPPRPFIGQLLDGPSLHVDAVVDGVAADGTVCWARVDASRHGIAAAARHLHRVHRVRLTSWPVLVPGGQA